ncbi:MAG: hypothetical protein ACFB0B_01060 [Thermonemataceae bacterium]
MGGLLFNLGRVSKERYQAIENALIPHLDRTFGDYYKIPRYYANKPDFGDMDIIVSDKLIGHQWEQVRQQLIETLGIERYKSTSKVFSTDYKGFQVDYFLVKHRYFESTYNFMCFNDLGNLIGKIYRRFNLKYGEEGLAYVYRRADGHYKKDLPITTDMAQICAFLALNYAQWKQGFESLEAMFRWIVASPYFSVAPYLTPTKKIEKRQKQRKTIEAFINWLKQQNITKTYPFKEKEKYVEKIIQFFPEAQLQTQIQVEQEKEAVAKQLAGKFNGHLVKQVTQLEGKALGAFINAYKQQIPDFEQFILARTEAEITHHINTFFQIWQKSV